MTDAAANLMMEASTFHPVAFDKMIWSLSSAAFEAYSSEEV